MVYDPVTAALIAVAYFCQFLNTVEGQKFAALYDGLVANLLALLHIKLGGTTASPTPPPVPPAS